MHIQECNFIYSSPSNALPDILRLVQLVETRDELAVLKFAQSLHLRSHPCADKFVEILKKAAQGNSWNEILMWLFNAGYCFKNEIKEAILSKDNAAVEKLLRLYQGDYKRDLIGSMSHETFLWHALEAKNYHAANLLIKQRATLDQPIPGQVVDKLKAKFRAEFFKNKYYYDSTGEKLCREIFDYGGNNLAYAVAAYYYPQDPAALDFLIEHPEYITFDILKIFIESGDASAFNKAKPIFLQSDTEKKKADLLHYALRDFNFSLMGFNFDYILSRLEIIKSILAENPHNRTLDKHAMSTFEIAQYLRMFLPEDASVELEQILADILQDPTGFHEIWRIQRLLINSFATMVNGVEVAHYPSVAQHIKNSVNSFLQQLSIPADWIFVSPSKSYTVEKCLEWIEDKQILKFFTGWSSGHDIGHGINVVIYEKYLFVCNRGGGSTETTCGVCIYNIQDKSYLKKIIPLLLERSKANEHFITNELMKYPQINLLQPIHMNCQRVRNCVWLSEKIGVLPCFIAFFLMQGGSLEDSIRLGKKYYKQWSDYDRFELLKAYLDHPYHDRDALQNEEEGIWLKDILLTILERAPTKRKSRYCHLALQKLGEEGFRGIYEELLLSLRFTGIEAALIDEDTSYALEFLDQFPDVNITNENGQTLLHLACQYGNLQLTEALIKKGADPLRLSKKLCIPLETLLECNAKVPHQLTRLMIAATDLDEAAKLKCFPLFTAMKQQNEFAFKEILKKGGNYILSKEYESPLSKVENDDQLKFCKLLLDYGVDVNQKDCQGRTPLMWHVRCDDIAIVELLFQSRNIDINVCDNNGETALSMAAERGGVSCFKALLHKGAKTNAHYGSETLYQIAERNFQPAICRLLREAGLRN